MKYPLSVETDKTNDKVGYVVDANNCLLCVFSRAVGQSTNAIENMKQIVESANTYDKIKRDILDAFKSTAHHGHNLPKGDKHG